MTLYEELELTPDCSVEDIKQQYRALARVHHPDLGGDEEKFKRIKFAYEVLSDPVRRKQYDETKSTVAQPDMRLEAINQLANVFSHVMNNFDPTAGRNLIELMQNEISSQHLLTVADISTCNRFITNLELTKERLKMKTDGQENIIMSFLDSQLNGRKKDLEIFDYRLKVLDAMTDILKDYQYGLIELPVFMGT